MVEVVVAVVSVDLAHYPMVAAALAPSIPLALAPSFTGDGDGNGVSVSVRGYRRSSFVVRRSWLPSFVVRRSSARTVVRRRPSLKNEDTFVQAGSAQKRKV